LDKQKIYSPNQVLAAAFLGGPMAMVFVLWKNFKVLDDRHGMRQILFWGTAFIVTLMLFSPLMSTSWPDYVIPFAYSGAAWSLADNFQMRKQAIRDSEQYEFQTAGNVIAVSIVFLVAMIVVSFVWVFLLAVIGLV
jgi:hypothetical protein